MADQSPEQIVRDGLEHMWDEPFGVPDPDEEIERAKAAFEAIMVRVEKAEQQAREQRGNSASWPYWHRRFEELKCERDEATERAHKAEAVAVLAGKLSNERQAALIRERSRANRAVRDLRTAVERTRQLTEALERVKRFLDRPTSVWERYGGRKGEDVAEAVGRIVDAAVGEPPSLSEPPEARKTMSAPTSLFDGGSYLLAGLRSADERHAIARLDVAIEEAAGLMPGSPTVKHLVDARDAVLRRLYDLSQRMDLKDEKNEAAVSLAEAIRRFAANG